VIDISIYSLLANGFSVNHLIANTISFIFGLLTNYLLSRTWVFGRQRHNFARDFVLFAVIGIIGLFFSNFILLFLIDFKILHMILTFLNNDQIVFLAKIIAVFLVLFWNFIARKKLVFNNAKDEIKNEQG
jgi:putative flippase GtrA